MGTRYSVNSQQPKPKKVRRRTLQLPPHLKGISQLCNLLDLTLPLVLQQVVVTCLKSSEFRDFVAPYLALIGNHCYPLDTFLAEPQTSNSQKVNQDFDLFCSESGANKSRMLILMIQFFMKAKSVKSVSNSTCCTLRMNHSTHRALSQFASSLGISNAEVLREMVAFAQEYPEDRFNLQALIYASRYNVSVPRGTYDCIKNLAQALDAGINDTASGLIDFCLANPDFLDSMEAVVNLPAPSPIEQYEQIQMGLF